MNNNDLTLCLNDELNPETSNLSTMDTHSLLAIINQADASVAEAVRQVIPQITVAVDQIAERIVKGGRLFYVGAGTSGRLAVLDSAECPPTFGTSPDLVQSIIAGGHSAMLHAVENVEDSHSESVIELKQRNAGANDIIVGLAASGRTPFTLSAIKYGNELDALTIAITTRGPGPITKLAQFSISPDVGPEVLSGSTRMKSGTAQKMMLGMLSTALMVRLGKVHRNLMVDVIASNEKLERRAERIVCEICGISQSEAARYLSYVDYKPRLAILMLELGVSVETAKKIAEQQNFSSLQQQLNNNAVESALLIQHTVPTTTSKYPIISL